jgi:glycosyltransferase involved in cell wall biosynthesis
VGQFVHRLDQRAWRRFERATIDQVQAVVALTEQDRQALLPLAQKTPIVQIPIGTVIGEPLDPLGSCQPNLLFVGNFKHAPNVDAAERLIETILPQICARCPDVTLTIVGASPPRRLLEQAKHNIVITGFVPDVTPYLDRATLVVAPLRLGGGMRVKVLEALAAGKAVVASSLAIEGLDLTDGEHILVADDDQALVAAIVELLCDVEKRYRLATAAYQWARLNLSWTRSATVYEALYRRLLQEAQRHPGAPTTQQAIDGKGVPA